MLNNLKKYLTKDYTCIAYVQDHLYISNQKGIKPIIQKIIIDNEYFKDGIVVDRVIGKAAALLLVKSHVKYVHAVVLSRPAKELFDYYHISYSYDQLVENISNRNHDGICPMEEIVLDCNDLQQGYEALLKKYYILNKKN